MKLPNTSKETATPETAVATPPSRKRPLSAANGAVGPLRPPSRAPATLSWGPLVCAPQISIPDSRLHLTSSRPRSRFQNNSVIFWEALNIKIEDSSSAVQCGGNVTFPFFHFGKDVCV